MIKSPLQLKTNANETEEEKKNSEQKGDTKRVGILEQQNRIHCPPNRENDLVTVNFGREQVPGTVNKRFDIFTSCTPTVAKAENETLRTA